MLATASVWADCKAQTLNPLRGRARLQVYDVVRDTGLMGPKERPLQVYLNAAHT